MNPLSASQREDVRELLAVCQDFGADAVIIGATAYRLLIDDVSRHTLDIDLALTLDLDDFLRFESVLERQGWKRSLHLEHRWTTPRDNRFDLLPAGPTLRKGRKIIWPRSGFVMSLAGFDHVFQYAGPHDLGNGLSVKVVPPAVLALLKITSYLENPDVRAKDLEDVERLLRWYESGSPRVFSDAVLQADLPDIDCAGAYLLGSDISALADADDRARVLTFLEKMDAFAADSLESNDPISRSRQRRLRDQLAAFRKAFNA